MRFELMNNAFAERPLKPLGYHAVQNIFTTNSVFVYIKMSGKRDSNPRLQPWQGCALPTELFPLKLQN